MNTLAHYIAMNDDLYCAEIYRRMTLGLSGLKASELSSMENLSGTVQCFLRDACRIMNIKIYKVEIYKDGKDPRFMLKELKNMK